MWPSGLAASATEASWSRPIGLAPAPVPVEAPRGRDGLCSAAAALCLAVAGEAAHAETAPPSQPDLIDCATIPRDADETALRKRFGRDAVKAVELDAAEGETERGTAIYPAVPARRLNLFWSDAAHRRRPTSVVIRDGSRWRVRLPNGKSLGLGASLDEVAAVNGKPYAVSGFFWDYGGYARDWHGGTLPGLPGGCTLTVRFDPAPTAPSAAAERASGEKTFASTSPVLKAVSPTVSVLTLDWPD